MSIERRGQPPHDGAQGQRIGEDPEGERFVDLPLRLLRSHLLEIPHLRVQAAADGLLEIGLVQGGVAHDGVGCGGQIPVALRRSGEGIRERSHPKIHSPAGVQMANVNEGTQVATDLLPMHLP